jgi:hypothetical protein
MIIFRINTETDLDLKQMTYYQETSWHKTGYILQYSLKTKKITFKAMRILCLRVEEKGFLSIFVGIRNIMSIIPYLFVLRVLGGPARPVCHENKN